MQSFDSGKVGVLQGSCLLFSDYAHGGVMWTGEGERESRHLVTFASAFMAPPLVHVSITMWDMDSATNARADIAAEHITPRGFQLVFRTWSDTRVAQLRADWLAIGALPDPELWLVD